MIELQLAPNPHAYARRLSPIQQQILQSLKDKGPGLLLEIAVRVLKFPEDIQAPLRELLSFGLVEAQNVRGGQFGAELYTLNVTGEAVLRLLNDPEFQREPIQNRTDTDTRRQEAELLNKLGDAAKASGDLAKAIDYYRKALEILQELSSNAPGAGGSP